MNIGELFVTLAVKGADNVVSKINDVNNALANVEKKSKPQDVGGMEAASSAFKPENEKRKSSFSEFSTNFNKKIKDTNKNLQDFFSVKPSDKTPKALDQVGDSMKKVGQMSLQTKAVILGAIYALDRLFSITGAKGTELLNVSAMLTGNTKALQQYQYVGKMAGLTNQEVAQSFVGLSDAMGKLSTTGEAPKFWGQLQRRIGGISAEDVRMFTLHPEMLLQRLQTYAQVEKDVGVRNQVLKSMVGANMAAILVRNKFTPQALDRAPVYSESGVKRLDQSRAAWADLANSFEMMFGRLNIVFGPKLAEGLKTIIPSLEKMISLFVKLSENLQAFKVLDLIFKGWGEIFGLINSALDKINLFTSPNTDKNKKEKEQAINDMTDTRSNAAFIDEVFGSMDSWLTTKVMRMSGYKEKEIDSFLKKNGWGKGKMFSIYDLLYKKSDENRLKSLLDNAKSRGESNKRKPSSKKDEQSSLSPRTYHLNQSFNIQTKTNNEPLEISEAINKVMKDTLLNLPSLVEIG